MLRESGKHKEDNRKFSLRTIQINDALLEKEVAEMEWEKDITP